MERPEDRARGDMTEGDMLAELTELEKSLGYDEKDTEEFLGNLPPWTLRRLWYHSIGRHDNAL